MRSLILMRGAPGCGKSTFIKEHKLEQYALSADNIRLMLQSPEQGVDGQLKISQDNDKLVWLTLFDILEKRMEKGEFTVIDATNSKTKEMTRYKELAEIYRYRIYVIDFTDLPIDICKQRNESRLTYKKVPEEVIDKMYSRFQGQKIPSSMTIVKPEEFENIVKMEPIDLTKYDKIHIIGDIHGCYTALQEYLGSKDSLNRNEYYIFAGDYIDRGIENAEVLNFLSEIKDNENVCFIQGNHERYIWEYANDLTTYSKEFNTNTKYELQSKNVNKSSLRQLYRRIRQCGYYIYDDKVLFISHAGISSMPENLLLLSTEQMIRGVGKYSDCQEIANTWVKSTPDNYYQIFGHRNPEMLPININERVFCLEGQVEFGGDLRVLTLDHNGFDCHYIKNNVFRKDNKSLIEESQKQILDVATLVANMRNSKYIQEKKFNNISSFNFTRDAFSKGRWNQDTVRARGLFINTNTNKIVARSYNKFFNINEMAETKIDIIKRSFSYPINIYRKENGYLGIIGYDEDSDELIITTKSSLIGDYVEWFKQIINEHHINLDFIKEECKSNNVSFIFEVIDVKNDPHIIEYVSNQIYLLEIISNDIEFAHEAYSDLTAIAHKIGCNFKKHTNTISNQSEFVKWYNEVTDDDYIDEFVEGFVIEDSKGFMVKIKLNYYKKWKKLRKVLEDVKRKGYIDRTSMLVDKEENDFYNWCRDNRDNLPCDIISARKMFNRR